MVKITLLNRPLTFFIMMFLGLYVMNCETQPENTKWVGTWSTAQQLVEPRNMPPEPGLSSNTIRQVVHVSIPGEQLRVSISNAFGPKPISIHKTHIAHSTGMDSIDVTTDTPLTFGGSPSVTIQPGESVLSDPFDFELPALANVAITMYVDSVHSELTGHPGSRTTSYILEGDQVSKPDFGGSVNTDHWYLIDRIDVKAPEHFAAVATLGNSITDGRGSGTNKQNRWPDELSRRLQANPETQHVAVLNQGIGGNCVLRPCLGPAAVDRFERDILEQPGIKWLIILEGVNDIGGIRTQEQADTTAKHMIAAYQDMIEQAHERDILVYGATTLPFGGTFYDHPASESARTQINEWIRNSGAFDAVIDLDKAMEDPDNPKHLIPEGDDGDGLHPSERGHQMMGEAIELSLFMEN